MSQDLLLKTPVAPDTPKLDKVRSSNQPAKVENTDETSFSSALDKQIEQHDTPKKETAEAVETSTEQSDDKIAENTDKDEGGKTLPENTEVESQSTETEHPLTTELIDGDVDISTVTELKDGSTKASATKVVSTESLVTAKAVTSEKSSIQSLNKSASSPEANTGFLGKGDATSGGLIDTDKKPLTTNLRSDIFHALSKNKSSESIALDNFGNKAVSKDTDRNQASFATALTSATTLNATTTQSSTTASPVLAVQPSMQSSAWNQVLSSRVVWMAREGIQEASLKLNPANLGSVEVKLNMHNDQVNVLFIAQSSATRDALEQALPKLRESFEENGMQLADADVTEQEFQQESEETASRDGGHGSNGQQSQHEQESEQQTISTEQEIEMGLSLYA